MRQFIEIHTNCKSGFQLGVGSNQAISLVLVLILAAKSNWEVIGFVSGSAHFRIENHTSPIVVKPKSKQSLRPVAKEKRSKEQQQHLFIPKKRQEKYHILKLTNMALAACDNHIRIEQCRSRVKFIC